MKKSERKQLAKRIAALEINVQNGINVEESKNEIMELSSRDDMDLMDLAELDELIQKYIDKMSK